MSNTTNTPENTQADTNNNFRGSWIVKDKLAFGVSVFSIVSILMILLIPVLICGGTPEQIYERWKETMNLVLPIIAGWMGTILVHYFSKESYSQAQESIKTLVNSVTSNAATAEARGEGAKVESIMLKTADIKFAPYVIDDSDFGEQLKKIRIVNLINQMNTMAGTDPKQKNRYPFKDAGDRLRFLLHKTSLEQFVAQAVLNVPSGDNVEEVVGDAAEAAESLEVEAIAQPTADALTLYDIYTGTDAILKGFLDVKASCVFVKSGSTLKEVQINMKAIPYCSDVFVTANGKYDEPLLGWITNDMLLEALKA